MLPNISKTMSMDIESIEVKCVINKSRSLVMSEGGIRDDAGVLYAHATATCMILRSST